VQRSPAVSLNSGVAMPQVGFGTWEVGRREVELALEAGYRSIDTASMYGNEREIGDAIAASGVARDELFVATKVWNDAHGYDAALRSFDQSLGRLGLDVLDLLLIHWPAPERDLYVETWQAFERLLADGAVRAIGVSNFEVEHLERLARETDVTPMVNQVELNPYLPQRPLREYGAAHGIVTEAWRPLGKGGPLLRDAAVVEIAERHGRTPAQVVLRWAIQQGIVVIPRSSRPERIAENLRVNDFELDRGDTERIDGLARAA
jgi:2,5-diketo-D-gluconate reductase A